MHSHQIKNFLGLSDFKILLFKAYKFPLTSVLPFCQYLDESLTFGKLVYINTFF